VNNNVGKKKKNIQREVQNEKGSGLVRNYKDLRKGRR
jgi:hypothetical protein